MKDLKNKGIAVGRAGHDPATYGLKGPLSEETSTRENSTAESDGAPREPSVDHPIGSRVVVTAGLAAGLRGIVRERSRVMFGDIPTYAVEFPGAMGLRVLRADYLKVAA